MTRVEHQAILPESDDEFGFGPAEPLEFATTDENPVDVTPDEPGTPTSGKPAVKMPPGGARRIATAIFIVLLVLAGVAALTIVGARDNRSHSNLRPSVRTGPVAARHNP